MTTSKKKERNPNIPVNSTQNVIPSFGWSRYAELINGRFAMIGFISLLLLEAISGETFLQWAGLLP